MTSSSTRPGSTRGRATSRTASASAASRTTFASGPALPDGPYGELSVRASELPAPPPAVTRAYIVENEITYLAFPLAPDALVIFGSGYAVHGLRPLSWLAQLDLTYWGDLDTHGFAILNRLRSHFPNARSVLMDRSTLLAHQAQWVTEPTPVTATLRLLTAEEQATYQALLAGTYGRAIRLEQERIRFSALEHALETLPLGRYRYSESVMSRPS